MQISSKHFEEFKNSVMCAHRVIETTEPTIFAELNPSFSGC